MSNLHDDVISNHLATAVNTHTGTTNYAAIKQQYLAGLPPGNTVDGGKAYDIRKFFNSPMGTLILNYFQKFFVNPPLNYYGLSEQNYKLWLAIRILSNDEPNLYARSLAADDALFNEFVDKAPKKN